jgi:hypothetical protein
VCTRSSARSEPSAAGLRWFIQAGRGLDGIEHAIGDQFQAVTREEPDQCVCPDEQGPTPSEGVMIDSP